MRLELQKALMAVCQVVVSINCCPGHLQVLQMSKDTRLGVHVADV